MCNTLIRIIYTANHKPGKKTAFDSPPPSSWRPHPCSQPHSASPIYVTSSSAIQFACTSTHGSNPSKTLLEPHKGSDYPRHQISESGADSALEWSQTRSWACWKRSLYPPETKTCPMDLSYEVCCSKPIPDHICVL